jgi:SAM-dependent methyltransferase
MTDWTDGYIADIDYIYGYYYELNPARARLALLLRGIAAGRTANACELGFGQGVSINIHSAASPVRWWGTDFNPSQAALARELGAFSGSADRLFDESFAEFAERTDLPEFDFIGLHGIWSWVSDENRATIVDFVRRRLRVGGVLYTSYNTQPGWAATVPLRNLLSEYAERIAPRGNGIRGRIDASLKFADELMAANPRFARVNPQIAGRIEAIKKMSPNYAAHEYFNQDWQPMSISDMARWLAPAKLDYACSANFIDLVDEINLTEDQRKFLARITDPIFQQAARDFIVNQQFRRDYWIKGRRPLSALARAEQLRAERVVLTQPRSAIELKVTGGIGESALHANVFEPTLNMLADHRPHSVAEIEAGVAAAGVNFEQLLQAITILCGKGCVSPAQSNEVASSWRKIATALNGALTERARGGDEFRFLASPITGEGVPVDRLSQLFLRASAQRGSEPATWAQQAWRVLSSQGQRMLKDGKALETEQENLAELGERAQRFADRDLKILQSLQVAQA